MEKFHLIYGAKTIAVDFRKHGNFSGVLCEELIDEPVVFLAPKNSFVWRVDRLR